MHSRNAHRRLPRRRVAVATAPLMLMATPAFSQAAPDADALAKQLSNPVAALISVPMQLNWDTGLGSGGDGERWTLNVQPVIPMSISEDWNLISRTIVPLIDQQDVIPGDSSQSGLGDITQSAFFSPKQPTSGGLIWGVGPVLLLPTGADQLTADQWGAGPTAVVLKQAGPWTVGFLGNHIWGLSNDGAGADVNATFAQPFVSKSLGKGVTGSLNFESTYDWNGGGWTLPLNLGLSKVTRFGSQLVSLQAGARWYADAPAGGPDWGLRFTFTLLFPR
jgi:hypothetical protein